MLSSWFFVVVVVCFPSLLRLSLRAEPSQLRHSTCEYVQFFGRRADTIAVLFAIDVVCAVCACAWQHALHHSLSGCGL